MSLNDISDLAAQIRGRGAKSVALQFPEGLKRKAAEIALQLRQEGFDVIISGDPCYGACDLPLGALTHADVLVHFGHAPVGEHPGVIYVPWQIGFDIAVLEKIVPLLQGKKTGLVTTVQHAHMVPQMVIFLEKHGIDVIVSQGKGRTPLRGQVLGCSFSAAKIPGADRILFVGTGVFHPVGISLATKKDVIALDPLTGEVQEVSGDSLLRRRFALMEKARGAKSFGIIVSSKSGQQRIELAKRLENLSPHAVVIMMGEVTPEELLNLGFMAYVNTACPRLAYDDQSRFHVPVLSPQEFEILMGTRTWDSYEIDEI